MFGFVFIVFILWEVTELMMFQEQFQVVVVVFFLIIGSQLHML